MGGATATDGITTALTAIADVPKGPGKPTPAVIVLTSDGSPTVGSDANRPSGRRRRRAVQAKSVSIDTIAFGTSGGVISAGQQARPVRPRCHGAHCIDSGGRTFSAETSAELGSIYEQIGRTRDSSRRYELTGTAAAALLVALVAVAYAWPGPVGRSRPA
jgi:hypothetical protein